jgi:hypothetical protein
MISAAAMRAVNVKTNLDALDALAVRHGEDIRGQVDAEVIRRITNAMRT